MVEKKMPSGKVLKMTMASFEEGNSLLKAVAREIESVKLTGDVFKEPDAIKNLIMRAIYSETIGESLKACLERCSYDNQQITNSIFEDEKLRGDYLPVIKEVLIYNLTPFFGAIGSLLKDIVPAGRVQP